MYTERAVQLVYRTTYVLIPIYMYLNLIYTPIQVEDDLIIISSTTLPQNIPRECEFFQRKLKTCIKEIWLKKFF